MKLFSYNKLKVKRLLASAAAVLCLTSAAPVFAYNHIEIKNASEISGCVYDGAGLLSSKELKVLSEDLTDTANDYKCEVAVVTLDNANGYDVHEYAKAIYNQCDYGYGTDKSGVMLLISMEEREWSFLTYGYANTAFTDYGIDYITDEVVPQLSDESYYNAFLTYNDLCGQFLKKARSGQAPYDYGNEAKLTLKDKAMPYLLSFGIALGIGLLICGGIAASMKMAATKQSANEYMEAGSFKLTKKQDRYLYTSKVRIPRPKENDSRGLRGGGSSIGGGGFGGSRGRF